MEEHTNDGGARKGWQSREGQLGRPSRSIPRALKNLTTAAQDKPVHYELACLLHDARRASRSNIPPLFDSPRRQIFQRRRELILAEYLGI
jgi:hypothetical protein